MLPYKSQLLGVFWNKTLNDALDALSKMIRKKIKILSSSIEIQLINDVPKSINPKEISTTLVYTKIVGKQSFVIITSFSLKHFLRLIEILLNKKIDYYEALNDENTNLVIELGNIIDGYFISSLNKLFDTKFKCEPPELSVSPYRVIEDFNFGDIYKKKVYVISFKSEFKVENENIEGKIFLLTDENIIDNILNAISKKVVLEL